MSNVKYYLLNDNKSAKGVFPDGTSFLIDSNCVDKAKEKSFYVCGKNVGQIYLTNSDGVRLHNYLFPHISGCEIDHINLDTLDNRRKNLRYCTHQQNQINQPLQRNNTSGVTGVSFYSPRKKYRARIKISQKEIHLGYYNSFIEAVQARNIGMKYMFGEFGRYNDVPEPSIEIKNKVYEKCKRYADLSVCRVFFIGEVETNNGKLKVR